MTDTILRKLAIAVERRFYARRLLDLYGALALDMGLTMMQQVYVIRLRQILRGMPEPIEDIELTFTNIANDLERTADAGQEGGAE